MLSHHATLFISSDPAVVIADLLQNKSGQYEFQVMHFATLGIVEVRRLIEQAYQRPAEASERVFVVAPQTIAPEAQQALLKVLEEPPSTTKFVFVMSSEAGLLPTVLSRFLIIKNLDDTNPTPQILTEFLNSSVPVRLSIVAEQSKQKDTTWWGDMAKALTNYLAIIDLSALEKGYLANLLTYHSARGASKKMIWEEMALRLPVATKQG